MADGAGEGGRMVLVGDCLEVMRTLDANSVDAVICDPPYGLGFMGKAWDHGVPGEPFWREALRVAKPGAHLLAFGGTRTFHRLACAIEDAGWQLRDTLMWVYGSGFPKSLDVSKAIDKTAGAQRDPSGVEPRRPNPRAMNPGGAGQRDCDASTRYDIPATEAARQWQGWGTALKPAWEPIVMARKPLAGTVAANVQTHGTGALNIDGCRVEGEKPRMTAIDSGARNNPILHTRSATGTGEMSTEGRWPANLIHDGSDEVVALFPQTESGVPMGTKAGGQGNSFGLFAGGIPVTGFGDKGSAARFFYCAKASKDDRDYGLDLGGFDFQEAGGMSGRNDGSMGSVTLSRNVHPTVKPTDLMRWLCRLVTPPGGLVLDPFTGSGSTGRGAIAEGMRFVGIELDPAYAAIAEARIRAIQPGLSLAGAA